MILEIDIGAGFVPVSCLTEVSQNDTTTVVGTTTRQNQGWRSSRPVKNDMTISGSGIIPLDIALFRYQDLVELKRNRTQFTWRIGDEIGFGFITEISAADTQGTDTAFTFTIQNTGQVTEGPPAGYSVQWLATSITGGNQGSIFFLISGGEVGASFTYTITSTGGGGPIAGSGTITNPAQSVGPLDVTSLGNGDVTVEVTLTNPAGAGPAVSDTIPKNAVPPPAGYSVDWITVPIDPGNETAAEFEIAAGTAGDGYSYTIYSSGGGSPITGSGTLATGTQSFIEDVSGLNVGTLTVEVQLSNSGGAGPTVSDTVSKNAPSPSGYAVEFVNDPILSQTPVIEISGGNGAGLTFSYAIIGIPSGGPVVGSNIPMQSTPFQFNAGDVGSIPNGTIQVNLTVIGGPGSTPESLSDQATKNI